MKRVLLLVLGAAFAALPALAQQRSFSCVGAEKLEDDVFSLAFQRGSAKLTDAARSPLAAAIEAALAQAQTNDFVLVAGKGHETGQVIGDTILPFKDVTHIHHLVSQSGGRHD